MKKLLLLGIAILSGAILLVSCSKELRNKDGNVDQANRSVMRMSGANFAFDEHEECLLEGANCHSIPPVIITPDCLGAIADAEAGW
jgi:hypothetical protein